MMNNDTPFPAEKTVVDLFLEQVARTPANIAVEFEGDTLSYKELNERSNQLAHYLISLGVQEDSLVPICLNRSMDMVIGIFGILKAGGAYVPIDPDYPIDRIEYIIQDTTGSVIITESDSSLAKGTKTAITICLDLDKEKIAKESIELPRNNLNDHHLAYVIYTSGSTGKPKGVMIEHRSLSNLLLSVKKSLRVSPLDKLLAVSTISFDIAGTEIYLPLITGATIYLVNYQTIKDGNLLNQIVANEGITLMQATPVTWRMMLSAGWEKPSNLKIICTGEAFPKDLAKKLLQRGTEVWNGYGPTETTIWSSLKQVTNAEAINIGTPIENTNIYILDDKQNLLPDGEVGEIAIGGKGVARGYINRPDLTRDKFIKSKFNDTDGNIYLTGDLGYLSDNGEITCLGRIDDQVKIRGYRIELGEIENIFQEMPCVKQAVVIAQGANSDSKRLIAYILPHGKFNKPETIKHLESKLPTYMIPSLLVEIEEIPLTPNGKIDKKALPNPELVNLTDTVYHPAKTELEKTILKIWNDILLINKIGIYDNFFELGGNSLLAQYLVAALSKKEIILPIVKLYQYPTISKIAEFLNGKNVLEKKKQKKQDSHTDIAVIAMSGRFPGADTIEELWNNLKDGKESIRFFSEEELDPTISSNLRKDPNYIKARGIINGAKEFDSNFFGINSKIAEVMDPQQRKFLEISWEALESAGYSSTESRKSIGIYAGSNNNSYYVNHIHPNKDILERVGAFQATVLNDNDYVATRVAYVLDLKGPAITVQSACSTSLLAIAQAVNGIRSGQCEMALAGGVAIHNPIHSGHLFEEGAILSRDGHCKTFDAEAQGTLFCDGAAIVLLKDKKQAELDGDCIYAVIKGVGISNDGRDKGSFTAPSAEGQASCISKALNDAEVDPSSISYIEAHGTATPIGDPIEIEGLNIAFGNQEKKQYCAIGSIKSNMGHLIHAAGAAGFIKTCLSIYNKQIPASINFTQPNPHLHLENSPFYVNDKLSDWHSTEKRRAGVSSFGVGGTNVHIILEEYPQAQKESSEGRPFELITWSAKNDKSREDYAIKLKHYLIDNPGTNIFDLAFTLHTNKAEFNHRRFTIACNQDELISKLNPIFLPTEIKIIKEGHDQLAFIFPGQGAQYINMGQELYRTEPVFKEAIDTCSELLKAEINEDIREVIYPILKSEEAEEKLNNTYYTQPALFITEYALAKLWMSWGVEPNIFIGHSIGEFVAAHLAGVFSLKDGLHLISSRAKLMADLPRGSMLAVRSNHESIESILPKGLSMAAINSPNLCVVAGPIEDVKDFFTLLEKKDIPSKLLHTSHAFHSSMMDSIIEPFERIVQSIQLNIPTTPIISTLTGQWMKDAEATDPKYWARHLRSTVLFSDAIKTLVEDNDRTIILESGPRSNSTTLVRQQLGDKPVVAIASLDYQLNQNEYYSFLKAVGQLWLNGVSLNWHNYYSNQQRIKLNNIPTYAFDKKVCWINLLPVTDQNHITNGSHIEHIPIQQQPEENNSSEKPLVENIAMRKVELIKKVKEILENASGIETDGVNPDSSFIEIGLDSLLLTQVALTLKKEFKLPITFRKLTEEYGSLSLLAEYLDANLPKETKPQPAAGSTNNANHLIVDPIAVLNNSSNHNHNSNTAIGLISQQIQLLAQQIALLQNEGPIQSSTPILVNGDQKTEAFEADITPEEVIELKKPFGATAKIEKHSKELSPQQKEYLEKLIVRYNEKTKKSKEYTQEHRSYMADPRVVSGFRPPTKEMVYQLVVNKSKGSRLWDIDGNEYIDMLNGFGSNMLGYQPDFIKEALIEQIENGYEIGPQHELAGEVSKLICEFTKHDRVALCNTGSEAVLGAMRIARTVTGRSLIVAFTGSYHGIIDEVLVRGTKKLKTFPAASGIMPESVQNMLILDYGTSESLKIIKERASEIAAVLVEPVQSRRPEFQPIEFLKDLRILTTSTGVALIFDEIITGFRMHPGGTQALFNIKADIATYGKVVGGGISIGIIAGKKEYMDALDGGYWEYGDDSTPEVGVTYFAGTFVRHPLALATAKASLLYMKERGPQLQEGMNLRTKDFTDELQKICTKYNLPIYIARFGSLWKVKYKEEYPYSELLFTLMREKGVHIWDGFPCFLVETHTQKELDSVILKFEESIIELLYNDFIPTDKPQEAQYQTETHYSFEEPPIQGALLGKDENGNPAWFLPDDNIPGNYLQINF